ncbi:MAG: hypothetical protein NWE84_02240 [Candidatus Bathyarchaeota archaeon]|nr:hypothetical protein [Candidatus Bathyarchaeota archaeon]
MAAPAMSHIICSIGLIVLIIVLPVIFASQRNSIVQDMARRELTEITDYTSNTLQNLFLLANSTNSKELTITKELIYLPLTVEGSFYTLSIQSIDGVNASSVSAFLNDNPTVEGSSWLVSGLQITSDQSIEISNKVITAGCERNASGFYVWLNEGE